MRVKALTMFAVTLLLAAAAWASSESVLYNFCSQTSCTDGAYPYAGLIADAKGNLYGTTYEYGADSSTPYGTVFELSHGTNGWTETVLHSFTGGTSDGAYPRAPLAFDKSGNLWGTTYQGGTYSYGVIFELKKSGKSWTETIIHSFASTNGKDGAYPYAALTFDTSGNIFGTTEYGGTNGVGIVFQLKPTKSSWTYRVIHNFKGQTDGAYPLGSITPGAQGYYYGTTWQGGPTYNDGTVFRLFETRGIWVGQIVYYFTGGAAGANPDSSLALDAKGNFYGTTYNGGAHNLGTVFKLAPKGKKYNQSVLHSFAGSVSDGEYPYYDAGVVVDAKGNIYGTTIYGGASNNPGTVFELKNTNGKYHEVVLHAFGGSGDGYYLYGGVTLFKGQLYGTTEAGGAHGTGIVFQVTP